MNADITSIKDQAEKKMNHSLSLMKDQFSKMRTGRASPGLIDHLKVACYESERPLNQIASVNVEDARTLRINVWDKTLIQAIEKALMSSDLGLNPNTAGPTIRVILPPLTAERRQDLVAVAKRIAEEARVAVRNTRQKANSEVKALLKAKEISEDEERGSQTKIQELTDQYVQLINQCLTAKEKDLTEI